VQRNITGYAPERMLFIGRPQINDALPAPSDYRSPPQGVKSVLYAPTWEGVTRATRYSSIDTHGVDLVNGLIEAGYQVVYRPHPLSGTRDLSISKADAQIRLLIKSTNALSNTGFQHYVDGSTFGWHLKKLDVMITDVSAVAYDWLVTGKPLLITKPEDRRAIIEEVALFQTLQALRMEELPHIENRIMLAAELASDNNGPLHKLRNYYYGNSVNYDSSFEQALRQALELHSETVAGSNLVEPGLFASRGSKLSLLRYLNFAIRSGAVMLGLWAPARVKAPETASIDQLFTHFSDPFNGRSIRPAASELWRLSALTGSKIVFATNQISTSIFVRCYFAARSIVSMRWRGIRIIPTITAGDSEVVLRRLTPKRVNYLKHHPINLMMLRSNGTEHVLYTPESDPLFEPGHSLIMYDKVITNSLKVREVVESCPKFAQPVVQATSDVG
jgi:hypothetical protein